MSLPKKIEAVPLVNFQANYWFTYSTQIGFQNYQTHTLFDDSLYAVGASISKDYTWAQGYRKFKLDLLEWLEQDQDVIAEKALKESE